MKRNLIHARDLFLVGLLAVFAAGIHRLDAQSTNAVERAGGLQVTSDEPNGPRYVASEILLKFKPGATDAEVSDLVQRGRITAVKHILTAAMEDHGDIGVTRATTSLPVRQALQALANHPAIELAQPNWVYTHQAAANDPYYTSGSLWGMYGGATIPANDFGSHAAVAWAGGSVGAKTVCVGVIDEGIQYSHPDLSANIWQNLTELQGAAGTDDDQNGYKDDIYGWNAFGDNGTIFDPLGDEHGTHVSGTIGALGGNGLGVVGVNWNVSIISGKFLGPNGGSTADAIQAVDYMTALRTRGVNIVALNNSWGGGGYDSLLLSAITRAAKAEILFVVAAGNGNFIGKAINTDTSPVYPACYNTSAGAGYDAVISVTAIAQNGTRPIWANYGATTVDLGAPGVSILSTVPTGGYATMDGTSMATPHVTGAIALYAAKYPGATAAAIKDALLATTTATASLSGKTLTSGRLDVEKFLAKVPAGWTDPSTKTAPAAPVNLTATVDATVVNAINLSWTDNSTDETYFTITRTAPGTPQASIMVGANVASYTDTGLLESTTYTYTVAACNGAGCSAETASQSAMTGQFTTPLAQVVFKGTDTTTQGTWVCGPYGADGYDIIQYSTHYPGYATVSVPQKLDWGWSPSTTSLRAFQKETNPGDRWLGCYYSTPGFMLDINLATDSARKIAFYVVDWDRYGRAQDIEICDYYRPTQVLHKQNVASFEDGKYLIYEIKGRVRVSFTSTSGDDAVLSGIFFDPLTQVVPSAPGGLTARAVSRTQINLTWTDGLTNETGFKIERSTSATTGFSQIAVVGPNVTSYASTGLSRGKTYYYRIRATNAAGDSSYSNVATATTFK